MILAALAGFLLPLPPVLHLIVAVLAGALGGAIWGFIPGILKARTGAHEVINTIMLNYVATLLPHLVDRAERRAGPEPDRRDQQGRSDASAQLPRLLGDNLRVHAGILLAVLATWAVAWLLNRSTFGFELRAVGANPDAARTAGISVGRTYVLVMVVAGALAGLGGANMVLGSTASALTPLVVAQIGFDGILVALLGRVKPWGVAAGRAAVRRAAGRRQPDAVVLRHLAGAGHRAPGADRHLHRRAGPGEGDLPAPGRARRPVADEPGEGLVSSMSTMAVADVAVAAVDEGFWTRSRKVGAGAAGCSACSPAVLFGALATGQQARFTLSEDAAGAALAINGTVGAILFGIIAVGRRRGAAGRRAEALVHRRCSASAWSAFVLSFLCWQVSAAPAGQNFMPLVNIVRGTFILALPLIFGALAGVLCERSGVVNVAIEGQLLMGAFGGGPGRHASPASVWVGLVARRHRRRVHLAAAGRLRHPLPGRPGRHGHRAEPARASASPASSTSG